MAIKSLKEFDNELLKAFPLETDEMWHETRGAMALPITGQLLRTTSALDIIQAIQSALPPDARLYNGMDGAISRLRTGNYNTSAIFDEVFFAVTSKDFPLIEQGQSFVPMRPIFYGEKPPEYRTEEEMLSMVQVHTIYPSRFDVHEFVIDKNTHTLEIPRDRETEDRIVIVVKPK